MRHPLFYIGGVIYMLCRRIWQMIAPLALMAV